MTFIKSNDSQYSDQLIKEASGLELLRKTIADNSIEELHIPEVREVSEQELKLQKIHSVSATSKSAMQQLGQGMAKLHAIKQPRYGLEEDNYIGLNPQKNGWSDDWGKFFYQKRLLFQVELISQSRIHDTYLEILIDKKEVLIDFLNQHCEHPSLVHGDLWSGNVLFDKEGPWLIDPAVYYGDREVDLAMSEMFGGFNHHFYEAYDQAFPRSPEYPTKKVIYNLYHYLNHFNLFGEGYLSACQRRFDLVQKL